MLIIPVFLLGALAVTICLAGIIEFKLHQRALGSIPLRIHVNGTRVSLVSHVW